MPARSHKRKWAMVKGTVEDGMRPPKMANPDALNFARLPAGRMSLRCRYVFWPNAQSDEASGDSPQYWYAVK